MSEFNSKFKIDWYKEKANLMVWNFTRKLPCPIKSYDVIPLMNIIFHRSFGNAKGNRKAVVDRGWYPLTQNLIEHTSLLRNTNDGSSTVDVPSFSVVSNSGQSLNICKEGVMDVIVLDTMHSEQAQFEGAKRAHEKRKKEG